MTTTYMLYAKAGREFEAAEEMRDLGLTVYCARKMEFKRTGNQRRPEPRILPYLPNYLFAEIPADLYLDAMAIRYMASTATPLIDQYVPRLKDFIAVTEAEFSTADKIKMNQEMIAEYKVGQALKCLDHGFNNVMLTFKGMVERGHDDFAKVQASMEMMGQHVTVELDPLQVRALG